MKMVVIVLVLVLLGGRHMTCHGDSHSYWLASVLFRRVHNRELTSLIADSTVTVTFKERVRFYFFNLLSSANRRFSLPYWHWLAIVDFHLHELVVIYGDEWRGASLSTISHAAVHTRRLLEEAGLVHVRDA